MPPDPPPLSTAAQREFAKAVMAHVLKVESALEADDDAAGREILKSVELLLHQAYYDYCACCHSLIESSALVERFRSEYAEILSLFRQVIDQQEVKKWCEMSRLVNTHAGRLVMVGGFQRPDLEESLPMFETAFRRALAAGSVVYASNILIRKQGLPPLFALCHPTSTIQYEFPALSFDGLAAFLDEFAALFRSRLSPL